MRTVDGLFVGNSLEIGPISVADRWGLKPAWWSWETSFIRLPVGGGNSRSDRSDRTKGTETSLPAFSIIPLSSARARRR